MTVWSFRAEKVTGSFQCNSTIRRGIFLHGFGRVKKKYRYGVVLDRRDSGEHTNGSYIFPCSKKQDSQRAYLLRVLYLFFIEKQQRPARAGLC